MIEIAGPEAVRMTDLVADFLKITGDTRQVIPDVHARYSDVEIDDRSLTPDAQRAPRPDPFQGLAQPKCGAGCVI